LGLRRCDERKIWRSLAADGLCDDCAQSGRAGIEPFHDFPDGDIHMLGNYHPDEQLRCAAHGLHGFDIKIAEYVIAAFTAQGENEGVLRLSAELPGFVIGSRVKCFSIGGFLAQEGAFE
jgi:hypothetical protein